MPFNRLLALLLFSFALSACAGGQTAQMEVDVSAHSEIPPIDGSNNAVTSKSTVNSRVSQDVSKSTGSSVSGGVRAIDKITTNNGIEVKSLIVIIVVFIFATLFFSMIIPRPKFITAIFP